MACGTMLPRAVWWLYFATAYAHHRLQGALVMPLMARGLQTGLIEFVLITGVKKG